MVTPNHIHASRSIGKGAHNNNRVQKLSLNTSLLDNIAQKALSLTPGAVAAAASGSSKIIQGTGSNPAGTRAQNAHAALARPWERAGVGAESLSNSAKHSQLSNSCFQTGMQAVEEIHQQRTEVKSMVSSSSAEEGGAVEEKPAESRAVGHMKKLLVGKQDRSAVANKSHNSIKQTQQDSNPSSANKPVVVTTPVAPVSAMSKIRAADQARMAALSGISSGGKKKRR